MLEKHRKYACTITKTFLMLEMDFNVEFLKAHVYMYHNIYIYIYISVSDFYFIQTARYKRKCFSSQILLWTKYTKKITYNPALKKRNEEVFRRAINWHRVYFLVLTTCQSCVCVLVLKRIVVASDRNIVLSSRLTTSHFFSVWVDKLADKLADCDLKKEGCKQVCI